MITLGEDALAKVKSGATSAEELFRVVTEVKEVRTLCPGCQRRRRRRLHGLPALRPPAQRRLPEVRPLAAGRLAVLPLLHDEHDARSPPRNSCAISARRRSCRRRTSLNSRTRTIVEKLLRACSRLAARRAGRRDQEGVPPRDRALPSRQGPASRAGIPGDGLGDRRRSDRGVPDPDGSGAAREVRRGPAAAPAPRPAAAARGRRPTPRRRPRAFAAPSCVRLRRGIGAAGPPRPRLDGGRRLRQARRACRGCATAIDDVMGTPNRCRRRVRHRGRDEAEARAVQEGRRERPPAGQVRAFVDADAVADVWPAR